MSLLPCPFCGSDDITIERTGTNRQSCIVTCEYCGCTLESNEIGSGVYWNRRHYPSTPLPLSTLRQDTAPSKVFTYTVPTTTNPPAPERATP